MSSAVEGNVDHKYTNVLIHRTLWSQELQGDVVVLT